MHVARIEHFYYLSCMYSLYYRGRDEVIHAGLVADKFRLVHIFIRFIATYELCFLHHIFSILCSIGHFEECEGCSFQNHARI